MKYEMDIEKPDVLVVGLGPAGSRAAEVAAMSGLDVVAVERRSQVERRYNARNSCLG